MSGRVIIGHSAGYHSEVWKPIPRAIIPAMGKEDFPIVLLVPPLAGISANVWGQMPESRMGRDDSPGTWLVSHSGVGAQSLGPDTRSETRFCQTQR